MAGGGSGGGSSTTVQKADPWVGLQPALSSLYGNANNWASNGGPVPQLQQQAPFNGVQQQAMAQGVQRAINGSPLEKQYQNIVANQANGTDVNSLMYQNIINNGGLAPGQPTSDYMSSVLQGGYLGSNPFLDASMNAADSATTRNFNTAVMPQLASQFSLAGRYGSGAQSQGINDATNNLATQLSNTNAGIMNTNYQFERGNQQSVANTLNNNWQNAIAGRVNNMNNGIGALTGAAQIDWNNMSKLGAIGDVQQASTQQGLNNMTAYQTAQQQQPYQNLQWLSTILNGGMSLNGSTSTQSGGSTPIQSGLGGALSGGMMGGAIAGASGGSITGPVGMGVGALAGGILGMI